MTDNLPLKVHFSCDRREFRILRENALNLVLQELKSKKNRKTGEVHSAWDTLGYYNPKGLERAIHEITSNNFEGQLLDYFKSINLKLSNISAQIDAIFEWSKNQ